MCCHREQKAGRREVVSPGRVQPLQKCEELRQEAGRLEAPLLWVRGVCVGPSVEAGPGERLPIRWVCGAGPVLKRPAGSTAALSSLWFRAVFPCRHNLYLLLFVLRGNDLFKGHDCALLESAEYACHLAGPE